MYERLRNELSMPLGYLVVNRLHRRRFDRTKLAELQQRSSGMSERERDLVAAVLDRALEEEGWSAIHAENLQRLSERIPLPRLELPFIFAEEFGPSHLQTLLGALDAQIVRGPRRLQSHGFPAG